MNENRTTRTLVLAALTAGTTLPLALACGGSNNQPPSTPAPSATVGYPGGG
jgi:hypothetical protein